MTNRIILGIAVLSLVTGGMWLACGGTEVTPPVAPTAASPDEGSKSTDGADTPAASSMTEETMAAWLQGDRGRPNWVEGAAQEVLVDLLRDRLGQMSPGDRANMYRRMLDDAERKNFEPAQAMVRSLLSDDGLRVAPSEPPDSQEVSDEEEAFKPFARSYFERAARRAREQVNERVRAKRSTIPRGGALFAMPFLVLPLQNCDEMRVHCIDSADAAYDVAYYYES